MSGPARRLAAPRQAAAPGDPAPVHAPPDHAPPRGAAAEQTAVPADAVTLHASCVALTDAAGLLLLGASGSGKSALALMLMGLGARLVADDRTVLRRGGDGRLMASAPAAIAGLIEARGIGLLRADPLPQAAVVLAADLDGTEPDRLPPHRRIVFCGCEIGLVNGPVTPHFPAALLQYLKAGRAA